jgi:exodeoxyribonuclease-3
MSSPSTLVSWNVNGLRAVLNKGFLEFVRSASPDVVCLQETKCQPDQVELDLPGYHLHFNCAEKKGYSGTSIFTRVKPLSVSCGLGIEKHDREGRVLACEFKHYFLVNVYTPNVQRTLDRLPYREKEWDPDFLAYLKGLEKKKPVVFCGDLNVAHTEIDLANPKSNKNNAGFTPQERTGFERLVAAGFVDTFREFEKGPGHYTWWSQRPGVRAKNIGWRIDYFLVSAALRPNLKSAGIRPDIMGSDHCPVTLELKW